MGFKLAFPVQVASGKIVLYLQVHFVCVCAVTEPFESQVCENLLILVIIVRFME